MAKNSEPIAKRCKALGISPAVMGYTNKDTFRNSYSKNRRKKSEYAMQLNEKQKVKFIYGILEKQFHSYYEKAAKAQGQTGVVLLTMIETRLDNVAFRTGFCKTRREARQAVSHGHFTVNGKKVNIPSYLVKAGDVIADGPSTSNGEIALGKNPLIGFMTWEGYNYEDAVLLNEDLVKADIFTSIHIEEYDCDARDTKLGQEEITRDIPNVSEEALKDLDERGIIRIGAEVRPGDILVGKVTPKGETELTAEERLLRAIFGEKAREVRDSSLRVPHGEAGKIVSVKVFTRENGDELPPGVNEQVRVHIAQKRKISEGDKMAGRHGNKGVVSRIMPREDMPFLPSGEPVQIVLNPLGVPSRMNIGQILETHLGWAARALGMQIEAGAEGLADRFEKAGYDVEKYGMPETVEIDKFGEESIKAMKMSVPVFDGAHDCQLRV